MNQVYHARHYTIRIVPRISASVAFFLVTAFFFPNTGQAQAPQQGGDPSGYRLIGTMEGAPLAGAVISDSTGTQTFYRLHELLPDGSQVTRVRSDSISLRRSDGTSYDLYFRGSGPGNQQNRTQATAAVPPPVVQETRPAYEQPAPATLNRGASGGQTPSKPRQRRRAQSSEE